VKVQTYVAAGIVAGLLAFGSAAMAQQGGGTGGPGGVDNGGKGMKTGPASGNLPSVQPASKEHPGVAARESGSGGAGGTTGMSGGGGSGASGTGSSGTQR
jgi:hypothetical protein